MGRGTWSHDTTCLCLNEKKRAGWAEERDKGTNGPGPVREEKAVQRKKGRKWKRRRGELGRRV